VVVLPPLREHLEDIPFLVERALSQCDPPRRPHVSLVEAALGRSWPGNVRELLREIAEAARRAPDTERVQAEHLDALAGHEFAALPRDADVPARIREALAREQGNVSRAARALGMHRTQLRRWLARQSPGNTEP
jgi:transcriptional regulator of acetoin/glycerol metabolism